MSLSVCFFCFSLPYTKSFFLQHTKENKFLRTRSYFFSFLPFRPVRCVRSHTQRRSPKGEERNGCHNNKYKNVVRVYVCMFFLLVDSYRLFRYKMNIVIVLWLPFFSCGDVHMLSSLSLRIKIKMYVLDSVEKSSFKTINVLTR